MTPPLDGSASLERMRVFNSARCVLGGQVVLLAEIRVVRDLAWLRLGTAVVGRLHHRQRNCPMQLTTPGRAWSGNA